MSDVDPDDAALIDDAALTDDERGNTMSARRRVATFAGIVTVIGACVVGIAYASDLTTDDGSTTPSASTIADAQATKQTRTPLAGDIAQADLVDREDKRIWRAVSKGTITQAGVRTIVLDKRPEGAYGVADLVTLGAAKRTKSVITITRPIVVRTGAALSIREPGKTLRLATGKKGFASVVAWGGKLSVSGSAKKPMKIVGWDTAVKAVDTDVTDGRGYLRTHSGTFEADNVTVDHLGFWSGRTGGLAVTGTTFDPGRALVENAVVRSTHIGLYLFDTSRSRITHATITGAERNGIELDRSPAAVLTDVSVTGSGLHGLWAHDHSSRLRVKGSTLTDNAGYGLSVDGRPRAEGPNTLGYGVDSASGLTVTRTEMSGNASGGALVAGTDKIVLDRLDIDENRRPLRILGPSTRATVEGSTLISGRGPVVEVEQGPQKVAITGNTLTGTTSGVSADGSDVSVVGNTITVSKGSAVSVEGTAATGAIADNTAVGEGRRAFSLDESVSGVTVDGNSTSEWKTVHPVIEWVEHNPFAPLWAAILLIPAIGVNFILRRYRMHRDLRRLTEETVIAMTRARRDGVPETAAAPAPELVPAGAVAPEPVHPEPEPAPTLTPSPSASAPTPGAMPVVTRTDRIITRGAMGQFRSSEDLAVHAVVEAGRSPAHVARTLQVSEAMVLDWVRRYLGDVEE